MRCRTTGRIAKSQEAGQKWSAMSKRISKKNQRRFVELLDAYLTKSGRKRVELARACHWDASMVTKLMKLDARPNLAVFH